MTPRNVAGHDFVHHACRALRLRVVARIPPAVANTDCPSFRQLALRAGTIGSMYSLSTTGEAADATYTMYVRGQNNVEVVRSCVTRRVRRNYPALHLDSSHRINPR
jgi:hypothetical protein